MKVLITGASGFLGKNLLEYIDDTKSLSRDEIFLLTSKPIEGYTCILHNNYTFTKDDFLKKNISEIDIVIHAGFSVPKITSEKYADETSSFSSIKNTYHLFTNLPSIPQKIIFISSVSVYGNSSEIISETSPTNPLTSYGCSKLYCEMMLSDYAESVGANLTILRLGQMYGKYSNANSMIDSTINKVINNEIPEIWSDGSEERAYIYVKDCCSAIIQTLFNGKSRNIINIAGFEKISILRLVNLIIEISGKKISPKILNNAHVRAYTYDDTILKTEFNIRNWTNLRNGLTETYIYNLNQKKNK